MRAFSKTAGYRASIGAAVLLMMFALSTIGFAQSKTANSPKPHIEIAADEKAEQEIQRIKDPDERVTAIVKFMAKYPDYPFLRSVSYSMTSLIKHNHDDPGKVRALVAKFQAGTQNAEPFARAEFSYEVSLSLQQNDVLPEDAEKIAREGLNFSNQDDYIANERRISELKEKYQHEKNPDRAPGVFSVDEAKEEYVAEHSAQIANMGDIERKFGKTEEAEKYYKQAYVIQPSMGAALGLSEVYETRGDRNDALKYLSDAALSGRLSPEKLSHLADLYSEVYPVKSAKSVSDYLDVLYRERFHSPVAASKYVPDPKRSTRVVLAEMITGSGCEPCTAVDLAFDAALNRYDVTELALIVYHMHAPTSDPLANQSSVERIASYGEDSAPSVYLDGKRVDVGEGLQTETPRVFESLIHAVDARLLVPAGGNLEVSAKLSGAIVEVKVSGTGLQNPDVGRHLQIALVENEVSYSGENGFRFHSMVVRNVAQSSKDSSGFPLPKTADFTVNYSFGLDQIMAANLKYYDEYIADLKARTGIAATFREKRYVIDPHKLSVVAFIQDDGTKGILQSAEVAVPAPDAKGNGG
ncbi:MAG: hypothetical protein WAM96_10800 [Candidatus Acidiferrales bacterium]